MTAPDDMTPESIRRFWGQVIGPRDPTAHHFPDRPVPGPV